MNASYTISNNIRNFLENSEETRKKIILSSLRPKKERVIKWNAAVKRIKWMIALSGTPMSDGEIIKIISRPYPKKASSAVKQVFAYKKVFEYIAEEWTASPAPINMNLVKKLYDLALKPHMGKMAGQTEISRKIIEDLFNFIAQGNEHPIVQAGIVHVEFINARLLENGNEEIARLLSYVILYKNGYNTRNLLSLEEFYKKDVVAYKDLILKSFREKSITTWLEYYSYGVMTSLAKTLETISNEESGRETSKSMMRLNDRQKEVLTFLGRPEAKITNRHYQKMFGVSQITASRDLSKLAGLGMVLSHGKGRSVFYTAGS